jgi:hypothetical protein
MAGKHIASAYFEKADQDAVRADLMGFFGPRPEAYLRYYDKRRRQILDGNKSIALGWSWSAFGGGIAWFWFRKLWGYGLLSLLIPMIADWMPIEVGGLLGYLLVTTQAKEWCLHTALLALAEADAKELAGAPRGDFLRRKGGVSWVGGMAGVVVVFAITVATVVPFLPMLIDQLEAAGMLR